MTLLRIILILLIASNCKNSSNDAIGKPDTLSNGLIILNRTPDSPYHYKDLVCTDSLKGNCQVYYAMNDSLYFLYLKKGDSLYLLNKTTQYTSLHHLGVVAGDEQKCFIIGHDNGNGAPYSYEYIDKQSGNNPLGYGKLLLDMASIGNTMYLLYADTLENAKAGLVLFNTDNRWKEYYELKAPYWELHIDTLTTKELGIRYTLNKEGSKLGYKIYHR